MWRARAAAIATSPDLRFLEDVAYKRRWLGSRGVFALKAATFAERAAEAASAELASMVEDVIRGATGRESVRHVWNELSRNDVASRLMQFMLQSTDETPEVVVGRVVAMDAVPYLAALRYTDTGLENRAAWEHTWDLQRREDAGEKLDEPIPVPPRYDSKDFRDAAFWRLRGKLDVPKERFISYPGAEKDDDRSPLFGWAGWDHLQQATALAALYLERKQEDGWTGERLMPLLAGLLELVPWLVQWHNEPREDFGGERLGDYYGRYVEAEARSLGKTLEDLRAWRPAGKRGRR